MPQVAAPLKNGEKQLPNQRKQRALGTIINRQSSRCNGAWRLQTRHVIGRSPRLTCHGFCSRLSIEKCKWALGPSWMRGHQKCVDSFAKTFRLIVSLLTGDTAPLRTKKTLRAPNYTRTACERLLFAGNQSSLGEQGSKGRRQQISGAFCEYLQTYSRQSNYSLFHEVVHLFDG